MTVDPAPQLMGQPAELTKCVFAISDDFVVSCKRGKKLTDSKPHIKYHYLLNAFGPIDRRLAGGRRSEKGGIFNHHQGLTFRSKPE